MDGGNDVPRRKELVESFAEENHKSKRFLDFARIAEPASQSTSDTQDLKQVHGAGATQSTHAASVPTTTH
eukprot:1482048-Rhodomonas_salina.2